MDENIQYENNEAVEAAGEVVAEMAENDPIGLAITIGAGALLTGGIAYGVWRLIDWKKHPDKYLAKKIAREAKKAIKADEKREAAEAKLAKYYEEHPEEYYEDDVVEEVAVEEA